MRASPTPVHCSKYLPDPDEAPKIQARNIRLLVHTVDDIECIIKVRYNKTTKESLKTFPLKRIDALPRPEEPTLRCQTYHYRRVSIHRGQKFVETFVFLSHNLTNEHLHSPTLPLYAHLVLK